MRRLGAGVCLALIWPLAASGQERDRSFERVSLAVRQPAPISDGVFAARTLPPPVTFGPFTLVPPEMRGEIIRVSFPIGEYVAKAFKGIASVNQRRQEAAARRRVDAALERFLERQPPPPPE
jgi:hypothetical protein